MAKTVLITGASSGIGRATAQAFLADDWTVWATARDEPDLADLPDGCVTAELDVTNARECERVVEDLVDAERRIDCLVNNAGYGQFGAVEDVSTEAVGDQFDVNLYGPHRLICEVLPHMRARENGTVVTLSDVAGKLALPSQGVYAASKHAVEGLHDALRAEVAQYDVDVVLVEPGPVETGFEERAVAEREATDATGAYDWLYEAADDARRSGVTDAFAVSPEAVALTVRDAANASDPRPRYPVGEAARVLLLARYLPPRWRDAAVDVVRRFV